MTDDLRGLQSEGTSSASYVILLSSSVALGNAASRASKKIKFEKLGYFGGGRMSQCQSGIFHPNLP